MNRALMHDTQGRATGQWFDLDAALVLGEDSDGSILYRTQKGAFVLGAPDCDGGNHEYYEMNLSDTAIWCVTNNIPPDELPDILVAGIEDLEV